MLRHRRDVVLSLVAAVLGSSCQTVVPLIEREIVDGVIIDQSNIAAAILKLTETPRDHVFTLHAELEGQKLAPIFEQLLKGWQAQGYKMGSLAYHYRSVTNQALPVGPVSWGQVPGRSGELIVQALSQAV